MTLNDEVIEKLTERLVTRAERVNTIILTEIAECLNQIQDLTPSKARQLAQVLKYGGNYERILRKLTELTDMSLEDVEEIVEEVAKQNYQFAEQFYKYRNIDYIPYEKNIELQNQVKELAKITANSFFNISRTEALGFYTEDLQGNRIMQGLRSTYVNAIDEAVLSVSQGKSNVQENIYRICKDLGTNGVKSVEWSSGYHRRLDSQVRMNIMDSIRDISNTLQEQFGKEYGADGVEITVHENPAPDHQDMQGHQYSISQFNTLNNSLKRHISECNCYHRTFYIVLGVSLPLYTESQLKGILEANRDGFEFEGKHYTNYEGAQLQRRLETAIRKQKDIRKMAQITNNDKLKTESNTKINQLLVKYNELNKISNLKPKIARLR